MSRGQMYVSLLCPHTTLYLNISTVWDVGCGQRGTFSLALCIFLPSFEISTQTESK